MSRLPRRPPPPPPDPEPQPELTPEKPVRLLEPAKVHRAVIARRYKGRRVLIRRRWFFEQEGLTTDES